MKWEFNNEDQMRYQRIYKHDYFIIGKYQIHLYLKRIIFLINITCFYIFIIYAFRFII